MSSRLARLIKAMGDHLLLSVAFLLSRALLYAAGLRFKLDLNWMFLADARDLQTALTHTVYWFHAFPPGMNLLTGLLLKLGPARVEWSAFAVFVAAGLTIVNCLLYLTRKCGLGRLASFALCVVFALLPPTLYFENLYLYTYPATALLCLAAALFLRAVQQPTFGAWFGFFLVCAVLGWLRSAFHLFWMLLMLGFALFAVRSERRVRVLLAAAFPLCLLLALYVKNLAQFGVFGATSWGGANLIAVTTARMPEPERQQWVSEGKLSPFALVSVFAPPSAYTRLLGTPQSAEWPELSALTRPSSGAGNFNHWYFLVVNPVRRADARAYLRERPMDYLKTVAGESLVQVFEPSTRWHPHDDKPGSPHFAHRQVLGWYEAAFNRFMHGFPVAPVGFYAFLPLVVAYGAWWAVRRLRRGAFTRDPRALLLLFAYFQIVFVVTVSSLFTLGECARYRYLVEPLIWVAAAHAIADASRKLGARLRARS